MLRFFIYFLPILLLSCSPTHSESYPPEPKDSPAQEELKRLQASNFNASESFGITPNDFLEGEFTPKYSWAHWKEELKYREDKIPRGYVFYSGEDDNFNESSASTVLWKNTYLTPITRISFSETGQVLMYINIDSTLYYYDVSDRLRSIIEFDDSSSEEMEGYRKFEYDDADNLTSQAVFFRNEEGTFYLNHYIKYSYLSCDSGFYVREQTHIVNRHSNKIESESLSYYYYDKNHLLRRQFDLFSSGGIALYEFSYQLVDNNYLLESRKMRDLFDNKYVQVEYKKRDNQGRLTYAGHGKSENPKTFTTWDSIIYQKDGKEIHYNRDPQRYITSSHSIKTFDDYHNIVHEITYNDETNTQSFFSEDKINYEYLPGGTWFRSTRILSIEGDDILEGFTEYSYRRFYADPIHDHNPTYQANPEIFDLINQAIPKEKQ